MLPIDFSIIVHAAVRHALHYVCTGVDRRLCIHYSTDVAMTGAIMTFCLARPVTSNHAIVSAQALELKHVAVDLQHLAQFCRCCKVFASFLDWNALITDPFCAVLRERSFSAWTVVVWLAQMLLTSVRCFESLTHQQLLFPAKSSTLQKFVLACGVHRLENLMY